MNAKNLVQNVNNGTLVNAEYVQDSTDTNNYSIYYSGNNSYTTLGYCDMGIDSVISMSIWIKTDSKNYQ